MTVDSRRRSVLAAGGTLMLSSLAAFRSAASAPRVIRVVARKFEFVPGEIHVKRGETVTLQFEAPEVPMGFNLADFKLRTDIVPGKLAALEFRPEKAGSFTFLCDVFCGSGHEDMSGTLIVS